MPKKDDGNIDWLRISDAVGDRVAPQLDSNGVGADNSVDPLSDNHGRQIVRLHNGSSFVPSYPNAANQTQRRTTVLVGSAPVNLGSDNLFIQTWGYNTDAVTSYFIQFHDSVGAPAAAAIPEFSLPVSPQGSFSLSVIPPGWNFINDTWLAVSSTVIPYTPIGTDPIYFNAITGN